MKVMVVHSSATGGGHRAAAESLVAALREHPGVEAESFDTLTLTDDRLKGVQKGLINATYDQPWVARTTFALSHEGNPVMAATVNTLNGLKGRFSGEALQHIRDYAPDLVVSTQGEVNAMLNSWKRRGKLDVPVHSVLTDHLADVRWSQKHVEHYYVANDRMVEDLARLGVDPSRVSVTGIPIKPEFAQTPTEDQRELRQRLGLNPEMTTLLVSGGAMGSQPYAEIVARLQEQPYPVQIVCICALNHSEKVAVEDLPPGPHPVVAMGPVTNMLDYLRASDLVVTKAGGLSTSEVMALGKPMILHNPLPGMEEAQAARLEREGAAMLAPNPTVLAQAVETMLGQPETLARASAAAARLGKSDSARTVARAILAGHSST